MSSLKKILFLIFVAFPFISNSQEVTITPISFDLDRNTHIVGMCQDENGFIWLADNFNGLVRFDGTNKKFYRSNPLDSNSLYSNQLECIYAGKGGIIWIGSINGLDRFDTNIGTFTHFQNNSFDTDKPVKEVVTALLEDQKGTLWIGTDKGLDTLDQKTGKFVHITDESLAGTQLNDAIVRTIYEDRAGTIWVGCGNPFSRKESSNSGLYKFEKEKGLITRYYHDPLDQKSLIDNRIRAIFEDSRGTFYVGSAGDGLHIMDREKGTFQRCPYNPENPNQLSRPPVNPNANFAYDHITFINEDAKGHIWIGTYAAGINRYDPDLKTTQFFGISGEGSQKLSKNDFWSVLKTNDQQLWISSWQPRNEKEILFRVSTFQNQFEYTELGKKVISFTEDSNNGIWIGTEDGLEGKNVDVSSDSFFSFVQNTLEKKYITKLSFDSIDNLWIVTQSGIYFFDSKKKDFKIFNQKESGFKNQSSRNLISILPNDDGMIWIGTNEGLEILNANTGNVKHYKHDPSDTTSINSKGILGLFKDFKGKIWILTRNGLNIYDPANDNFQQALITSQVTGIFGDSQSRMWVSTLRSGLFMKDNLSKSFKSYNDSSGLITNILLINGLVGDSSGFIWLNTDMGFIKIDPETKKGVLFGQSWKSRFDNNLTSYITFISKNGEIYSEGDKGYFHFLPQNLETQYQEPPKPYLNTFFLGNQQVLPKQGKLLPRALSQTNQIKLPYNQNSFSFGLGDIDFVTDESEKNLQYKLKNYNEKWEKGNIARYNNISPGEYELNIKSTNRYGKIGHRSISILIMPPWFTRWWAWVAYLFIISGLLYWVYNFLIHRKLAKAEVIRLKELDLVKSQLYTNLTHEFRTPLTVISGITNNIIEETYSKNLKNRLSMILRNSQALLRLINHMLDLSKLESGSLPTKMVQDDIIGYIKYLLEPFCSLAKSKDIRLHFLTDIEKLDMDFDPEKIQSIFSNLLGNSIKFTSTGGNIYVTVNVLKPNKYEELIEFKVRDTGKGISEDQLPYIFDRFYQCDNSSTRQGEGTGIGLALTAELVKLLEGTIEVESKIEKGTEFTLKLPIHRKATKVLAMELVQELPLIDENVAEDLIFHGEDTYGDLPLALLIEDHQDILDYLCICLKGNYRIQMASDGLIGIQKAIDLIPDIIVSDVMMPGKNGFELVETLKQDERTSHIPIILLTAKGDIDSRLEGLECGADAYLAKPFEKKELEVRLRKLMELRKLLSIRYSSIFPVGSPSTYVEAREDAFLKKFREIVESNLENEDFGISHICLELGISRTQLHRKLKALTEKSTSQIIRTIRMQEAKKLLRNHELNISEIGYAVGYGNPSHFSQEFTKEFGEAPTSFRKSE